MVTSDNKLRNVDILVVDMLEQNILDHLVFTNYLMYKLKSVFVWFSKSLKEYVLSWTIMNDLNVIVTHILNAIYKW